jgi:hypothetical protein
MGAELLIAGLGVVFTVLWYLLRQKDAKQGEEIAEIRRQHKDDIDQLYKLHHKDVEKLAQLELEIAKNHYPKNELDKRFEQLDATIKYGFKSLGDDIREMTSALNEHLKEHRVGG